MNKSLYQQVARLTAPNILEVEDICCQISGQSVLKNLSFTVPAGSFCCLLGRSGSGKTILFKSLAGLQQIQKGTIKINGNTIVEQGKSLVSSDQHKVGLVFQDYTLFPHLSVRDNLLFGIPKCSRIEQQEIVDKLLNLIGLVGYDDRFPHELSGGQQQRVALARTLAPDPALVLLDEPFSNIDQEQRLNLAQQVKHILRQQSVSALLITHDQKEAFMFADYIGIIIDGHLVQWGTPQDIYYRPVSDEIAEFIGFGRWYDCQLFNDDGTEKLATPFGIIDLHSPEISLTEETKKFLNRFGNRDNKELQIFLRQENIYLPIDQDAFIINDTKTQYATENLDVEFPVIQSWKVISKHFVGFLTYLDLVAVLPNHPRFASSYKRLPEIQVFIRSTRNISVGQKVRVELEVNQLILRQVDSS